MPHYLALGELPAKKHTLFTASSGEPCFEEFIGEEGFSSTGLAALPHAASPPRWSTPARGSSAS